MSSNSLDERAGRILVTVSRDLLKEEEEGNDDEYDEGDDYGRGGYVI